MKCLFFIVLFGVVMKCYGQATDSKLSFDATLNYAFLGEGDYGCLYYDNSLIYSVKPSFQILATLGFLISSNDGSSNIILSHNNSYLLGDLLFRIIPIKTRNINFYFGFGNSNRYRSEIELQSVYTYNQETIITYTNEVSFDFGYLGQIGLGYKVSPKTTIILIGELHGYNKGTAISSFGMGINIKL